MISYVTGVLLERSNRDLVAYIDQPDLLSMAVNEVLANSQECIDTLESQKVDLDSHRLDSIGSLQFGSIQVSVYYILSQI